MSETYYVAVGPDGTIKGPVSVEYGYVKECLIVGLARTLGVSMISADALWHEVQGAGHSIEECEIIIKSKPKGTLQ